MHIIYQDRDIIVCMKPPRIVSTDIPGGLPDLLRKELSDSNANIRTVHRLDQVVSGLMVLARRSKAASELSRQIREGEFHKEYLGVIHGIPSPMQGSFHDLLMRNSQERRTYVVTEKQKGAQDAILNYRVLASHHNVSLVQIKLITGRTHQIRVQFSSRGFPLVGDQKYGIEDEADNIALWSYQLSFNHPYSGKPLCFHGLPPLNCPWNSFQEELQRLS